MAGSRADEEIRVEVISNGVASAPRRYRPRRRAAVVALAGLCALLALLFGRAGRTPGGVDRAGPRPSISQTGERPAPTSRELLPGRSDSLLFESSPGGVASVVDLETGARCN